jgi:hypothetical protein
MKISTNGGKRMLALCGLTLTIVLCSIPEKQVYIKAQEPQKIKKTEKQIIVQKIAETFPEEKKTMLAIAIAESGLKTTAVNYNCRYKVGGSTYDKLTDTYIDLKMTSKSQKGGYISTWCRKGDNAKAWSKDGSIFQINGIQTDSVDENIRLAKQKYDTQGKKAWVAYKTGSYTKHLKEAEQLLADI